MARLKLGDIFIGSALIVGTAVLVAKNEKVRQRVSDYADVAQRVWKKLVEKGEARMRRRSQAGPIRI